VLLRCPCGKSPLSRRSAAKARSIPLADVRRVGRAGLAAP
jgi:hypothetical protein